MAASIFITGTDTGVGKTVLTFLLTVFLRGGKNSLAAFKPLCTGNRADARALHAAQGGSMALNEVNPWFFKAPISPAQAALRQKKSVSKKIVLRHILSRARSYDLLLVEGAGGLLSPLGMDFDNRDLLVALDATPLIVAPNRLGVINQVRLACSALPPVFLRRCAVVLMAPRRPDASTSSNRMELAGWLEGVPVHEFPWLASPLSARTVAHPKVLPALKAICKILIKPS